MNKKKIAAFALIALCPATTLWAQRYMDHLRRDKLGRGTVSVVQSKAIDELVNGKDAPAAAPTTAAPAKPGGTPKPRTETITAPPTTSPAPEAPRGAAARKETEVRPREVERPEQAESEAEPPMADMRKKVMRGSHKVTGYRVQVYAGGNTREDKQRAQQAGTAVKMKYPDQPVYVHFYSPRWLCRVGNFRTYQEAQQFLKQVKTMGYGAATIVKGQISVQY